MNKDFAKKDIIYLEPRVAMYNDGKHELQKMTCVNQLFHFSVVTKAFQVRGVFDWYKF